MTDFNLHFLDISLPDFHICYRVNTLGVINGTTAEAPQISGRGCIFNESLLAATRGGAQLTSKKLAS